MEKSQKQSREIIARVRIGSVVYGTNVDYSDIDYRTIVKGDVMIPQDENDREITYLSWLTLVTQRDAFSVEIAQAANEDVLETSDSFSVVRGCDFFDAQLAKSYNSYAIVFLERYQTRQGADHKNLMNACSFAWRGFEISKGNKPALMLLPDLQYDMRTIRRVGIGELADSYIALLGKY